jgi:hypothetical protein
MRPSPRYGVAAATVALLCASSVAAGSGSAGAHGFTYGISHRGEAVSGIDVADGGFVHGSALAIDSAGGAHVLWYRGGPHPALYLTQRRGSHTWRRHATSLDLGQQAANSNDEAEATSVALGLSIDRRRLYAVATDCAGVYTTSTAATKTSLPTFHKALDEPAKVCEYEIDDDGVYAGEAPRYRVESATALPHHRLGLLVTSIRPKVAGTPVDAAVFYVGRPGHAFHVESSITNSPATNVTAFARDPVSGELVAAGGGFVGSTPVLVAWTKKVGEPWSSPDVVATGSDDPDHQIQFYAESVAASNGRIYLATSRAESRGPVTSYDDALLLSRTAHGTWRSPEHFPHLDKTTDHSLSLMTNEMTDHVHVAFSRGGDNPYRGELMKSTRIRGRWGVPTEVRGRCYCTPEDLAFSPSGHLVIGYQRVSPE